MKRFIKSQPGSGLHGPHTEAEPAGLGRERPILFSAPMVRALLAGTKTQTRRAVKSNPVAMVRMIGADDRPTGEFGLCETHDRVINRHVSCPYGVLGDTLWVRETLKRAPDLWTYAADGAEVGWPARRDLAGKARDTVVSIHMPRWASRIMLRVTDVRVERLNEISEADALAEGAPRGGFDEDGRFYENPVGPDRGTYRAGHCGVWEHINGPGSWAANPWVWAVSFEVITGGEAASPEGLPAPQDDQIQKAVKP